MIWRRTATDHLAAIGGFARMWLSWGILDRLIPVTLLGWLWCGVWFWLGVATRDPSTMLVIMFFTWPLPWLLLALDAWMDKTRSTPMSRSLLTMAPSWPLVANTSVAILNCRTGASPTCYLKAHARTRRWPWCFLPRSLVQPRPEWPPTPYDKRRSAIYYQCSMSAR